MELTKEHLDEELLKEFERLIETISKDVIKSSVMQELYVLKEDMSKSVTIVPIEINKIREFTAYLAQLKNETGMTINKLSTELAKFNSQMENYLRDIRSEYSKMSGEFNTTYTNILDKTQAKLESDIKRLYELLNKQGQKIDSLINDQNNKYELFQELLGTQAKKLSNDLKVLENKNSQNIEFLRSETNKNMKVVKWMIIGNILLVVANLYLLIARG